MKEFVRENELGQAQSFWTSKIENVFTQFSQNFYCAETSNLGTNLWALSSGLKYGVVVHEDELRLHQFTILDTVVKQRFVIWWLTSTLV